MRAPARTPDSATKTRMARASDEPIAVECKIRGKVELAYFAELSSPRRLCGYRALRCLILGRFRY
jgi:hypothetical protein